MIFQTKHIFKIYLNTFLNTKTNRKYIKLIYLQNNTLHKKELLSMNLTYIVCDIEL
jgi:hypothetical protein